MDIYRDLHRHGDRTALIDARGTRYSYRELHDMVTAFGAALPSAGRALILLRTRNRVESLVGYLGGIAANHVVLPVDHSVGDDLLHHVTQAYRPEYVWDESTGEGAPLFTAGSYRLVRTGHAPGGSDLHEQLSAVLLTSGSTGSPKGVRLSRRNLNANASSIAEYLELDPSERAITSLPMSYSYGLSVVNSHLWVGGTLLLTDDSLVRREFWEFFREHGATSFSGVPYTYEMLDTLRFARMELPSLRSFTQAGGKLHAETVERYAAEARKRSARFYVMYGQTEATARIAYLRADLHPDKSESIGAAIPDGKLYLKDANGLAVSEPRMHGDLHYEGANVMLGHARDRADLIKGDELGGCLDTRDVAYFDDDGNYYIVGRRSRFVKMSGVRTDLDQIERHLREAGFACVCGGKDEELSIALEDISAARLVRQLLRRTFRIDPRQVRLMEVAEIPKTAHGKTDYARLFGATDEGGSR
ncbi:AMP-binding protein [Streptomyces hyaluromycini]|uniref:AMP-binding protein n=1 Tax=Streptomyces hyaluromycini TaxID=1377993 RepID=UPI00142E388F|nr:AMP-binding protein [Streptomyces hyaluromycini]